ncbi:MAG: xanthine dehydrogenase family protein subunit M [Actinobacteria bacterium]|nr:xanthine dehydrogenase family protein subunit M [Thermoleophilia bacterium]MCB9011489.1 xanthine dehydrogenase family protein subunit M [Actinomycetota bacterium]
MRLTPFEIHTPTTLEEAAGLISRHGEDAVLYAGGTELLLVMKLGFAEYGHLIDIKGIPELSAIDRDGPDLRIGGCATHRSIETSALVRDDWPALAEMLRGVANVRVRGSGTLGGNLAFADPHSDPATFLLAVGAQVEVWGAGGRRMVPIDQFVLGPYWTALEAGEVISAVLVPPVPAGGAVAHRKIAFHERPAVTVSCMVRNEGGRVAEARIAVGSVGLAPARLTATEAAMMAGEPADRLQALAQDECDPTEDANGAVDYKRHLVGVLVRRTVDEARARAGGTN